MKDSDFRFSVGSDWQIYSQSQYPIYHAKNIKKLEAKEQIILVKKLFYLISESKRK